MRRLGQGGMGAVYEAVQSGLGRRVALKVISAKLAREQVYLERFRREALAVAQLGHPNIVQVTDFGTDDASGLPYIAMELLAGDALLALVKKGPVDPERARHITIQLLSALHAAHANGIVHRDLKPANVFLVPLANGDDLVKLLDFGIAKLMDSSTWSRLTQTGVLIGTPRYSAPEQITGKNVGPRVDVHSAGVLLYCMLTGRPPFLSSGAHLLVDIQQNEAPAPDSLVPGLDPALVAIVVRAMRKRPEDRFATAAEMGAALEALRPSESRRRGSGPVASAPETSGSTDSSRSAPSASSTHHSSWHNIQPPVTNGGTRGPIALEASTFAPSTVAPAMVAPATVAPRTFVPRVAPSAVRPPGRRVWRWLAGGLGALLLASLGAGAVLAVWFSGVLERDEDSAGPAPFAPPIVAPAGPSHDEGAPTALRMGAGPLPASCVRLRWETCLGQPASEECIALVRRMDAYRVPEVDSYAVVNSSCGTALDTRRRNHPHPAAPPVAETCSPACDPAEYCHEGSCQPRPLLVIETSEADGCVDLGHSHLSPSFAHRVRLFGRPGGATVVSTMNTSCTTSARGRPGPTLDDAGAAATTVFEQWDSLDCTAPRQVYAVAEVTLWVDDLRSNAAHYINYNSACSGPVHTCEGVRAAGCGRAGDPIR